MEEELLQRHLSELGLSVSVSPEKGRCLFTTNQFSPGEIIISQQPYVSVPKDSSGASRCEVCFCSAKLKKCSACHFVWYCGSTCQKSDWMFHRVECQALSKLEKERLKHLTPSIRLMVKLYLRKKLQDEKVIPTTVTDNYNLVEALVSHMTEIDDKQLVLYAQMANLVHVILQWPGLKLKEVAENFSKLACNVHSICDSELRPLGIGLYPVISIINHSCLPNAVLMFEGKQAVVRAVQPIPKGTEVLISYIETAGSTMTRQKALKEQYLFSCSCPRCIKLGQCEDIRESSILEGYGCENNACMGFLLRDSENKAFICQQCGHARKLEDLRKIASEVKTFSEKAEESLKSGNNEEAGSMYKAVEKLQIRLCHPLSLNLMRTRDHLLKVFMELKNWKDALDYCRMTIPVYEKAYPGCHPMLGLQYYTCGKLEWLLGETANCVRSLTKAVDILRLTHGTNTPFIKELLFKLEEARAEASFKLKPLDED
ncbi:histone-lysine N-methyltransferase ASHR1-like isoform X1 [Chenopodium quinoa]|uniref:histone-lysine N-methyltransferase ASHR1-like isoform X1 n=1 Tax=Chenopodium quinoa TaxID=63459 RepID=UPI000B77867F|nr:histone-lysine N-methyltransferase ASHR1-like isoform X1 [Chenopodium quinoa]